MKFSSTLVAAVAALVPFVEGHAKMSKPAPYAFNKDNAPLAADGSNFPCKGSGSTASQGEIQTYTPGQPAEFEIVGSAVHGGGSCQVSICYDNPPKPDSVFKVIQSYEGACPLFTPGNLPDNPEGKLPAFSVTLPMGLKSGEAVFVWTWFNKVGNREMYMNCAPIMIGGTESSMGMYNKLPDMFVANIKVPQSQCTTSENVDITFPNPGAMVTRSKENCNFQAACGGAPYKAPASPAAPAAPESPKETPKPTAVPDAGGAFVGVTSPVYNAPPASKFTPVNPVPSTTMSTVAAMPTGSYGGGSSGTPPPSSGSGSGSGTPPPSYGSGSGSGTPPPPSEGSGSGSGTPPPTYGGGSGSSSGGNGSAPSPGKCDGSWIVSCDASDPRHFTLCYGKGQMMQKFACQDGMTCDQVAKAHPGAYKSKFKRTAREHIKRMTHRHSRH